MPQCIVDVLEIIQVEKQQRQLLAGLVYFDNFLFHPVHQHAAIRQIRQEIEIRLTPYHVFRFLLLREIIGEFNVIANGPVFVVNHIDCQP